MEQLDKTTLVVILYLIERLNGILGKTHLQKMLFLSDLISSKRYKEKITSLEYEKYHFGPYASELDTYTSELETRGLIEKKEYNFTSDNTKTYTRFYKKLPESIKPQLIKSLKPPEKVILLDEIIDSYGNLSLQEVLDIVYQLEIVKSTEKNTPLEFARENSIDSSKENEEDII